MGKIASPQQTLKTKEIDPSTHTFPWTKLEDTRDNPDMNKTIQKTKERKENRLSNFPHSHTFPWAK